MLSNAVNPENSRKAARKAQYRRPSVRPIVEAWVIGLTSLVLLFTLVSASVGYSGW
jgi:hypothetical protein